MTSMRISTHAACSCSATPCCSVLLSHPLPPCVKMMTPSVISQGSAPDTTHHRESLFFFSPFPQRWFVLWLRHCCIQGALVLWQTQGFPHRRKCGGGALIDSSVRNAKAAPVPIWSQRWHTLALPTLGLWGWAWVWQPPGFTVEIT